MVKPNTQAKYFVLKMILGKDNNKLKYRSYVIYFSNIDP